MDTSRARGLDSRVGFLGAECAERPTTDVRTTVLPNARWKEGASFDHTILVPDAKFASAAVIAEQSGNTQGPLSKFDTVSFTGCTIDNQPLAAAHPLRLTMGDAVGTTSIADRDRPKRKLPSHLDR